MKNEKVIPVFFATDDNYAPFLGVTLKSMFENASREYFYEVYVLITSLNSKNKRNIIRCIDKKIGHIRFVNVSSELAKLGSELALRDYYSLATYYRFFISELFPQYDKALYLDCDIAVTGDISELYNYNIDRKYVGAVKDDVIAREKHLVAYLNDCLDLSVSQYFNAGILVMNTKLFREKKVLQQFIDLKAKYKFTVAQDQDYLNEICRDNVRYLPAGWNKSAFHDEEFDIKGLKIVHFKMNFKPWHFDNVEFSDIFWSYAAKTPYFEDIKKVKSEFNEFKQQQSALGYKKLIALAAEEAYRPDNFKNTVLKSHSKVSYGG